MPCGGIPAVAGDDESADEYARTTAGYGGSADAAAGYLLVFVTVGGTLAVLFVRQTRNEVFAPRRRRPWD